MSKPSTKQLLTEIRDAKYLLNESLEAVDISDPDNLTAEDLNNARSELANASNAIDDAMGEIDKLLAPERTREESYDA